MNANAIDRRQASPWASKLVTGLLILFIFSTGFMMPGLDIVQSHIAPSDLLFPLLFLSYTVAVAVGAIRLRWHYAYLFIAFYLFAMCISCLFSVDRRHSAIELAAEVYLLLIPVMIFNAVRNVSAMRSLVLAWLAAATVTISIGLFTVLLFYIDRTNPLVELFSFHYGAVPVGNYPRIASTFVSASMFCNYLNVTFFLLVIAYVKEWIARWLFVSSILAVTICAVFTISAGLGAFVLSVALLGAFVVARHRKWIARCVLAAGMIGAISLTSLSFIELNASRSSPPVVGFSAPSARVTIWKQALETIAEHPFTGKGLGTPVVDVVYTNAEGTVSRLTDAHNVFLNVGAEFGLPAIAAMIALCLFLIWPAIGRKHKLLASEHAWLIAAFFASFVLQGLTGSFEDARHLWVLIGFMLSAELPAEAIV